MSGVKQLYDAKGFKGNIRNWMRMVYLYVEYEWNARRWTSQIEVRHLLTYPGSFAIYPQH
jgi:hypothetical protein